MMLGHILHGQGFVVLGEAQERIEQRHIHIDVVANLAVIAGRSGRAVRNILHRIILETHSVWYLGLWVRVKRTLNMSRSMCVAPG